MRNRTSGRSVGSSAASRRPGKSRLPDKTDLEKRIAEKEAEQNKLEAQKASLGGALPGC